MGKTVYGELCRFELKDALTRLALPAGPETHQILGVRDNAATNIPEVWVLVRNRPDLDENGKWNSIQIRRVTELELSSLDYLLRGWPYIGRTSSSYVFVEPSGSYKVFLPDETEQVYLNDSRFIVDVE